MEKICLGRRSVRVHNNSSLTVDVFLRRANSQSASILGTAPIGTTEFGLPETPANVQTWYEARRSDGTSVAPAFGNQRDFDRIKYETICHDGTE